MAARSTRNRSPLSAPLACGLLVALVFALTAGTAQAGAAIRSGDVIPGHYIVALEESVAAPAAVAQAQTERYGGRAGLVYRHALKGYSAQLSPAAVERLRRDPRVRYVAPVHVYETQTQTIPTGISRIFAVERPDIDIDETDDVRANVDVAVIDTGVDPNHPDLNVVRRVDCVPSEENPSGCAENAGTDGYGHGTHVAGTIGALDNSYGAVGVAPGARLWSVRVLNENGTGTTGTIAAGIDWVAGHADEIEVANISLGCHCTDTPVDDAISGYMDEGKEVPGAVDKGVVIVAAAGNFDANAEEYSPAGNPDVITVSALADYDGKAGGLTPQSCDTNHQRGEDDTLATFSNWGPPVDIAAPGVCIYSTLPTTGSAFGKDYGTLSGTSMATPHVTGAAALLASQENPNDAAAVAAIRQQLVDEGSLNWEDLSGDGEQEPLLDMRPTATEAITTRATELYAHSATVNGIVNPGGLATTYRFQYGPSTEYASSVPAVAQAAGSGAEDIKVSALIPVEPGRPYHYRLVAENSKGSFYGQDETVTTSSWIDTKPLRPKWGEFHGISCSFADDCLAVGQYSFLMSETPNYYLPHSLAQHWTGSSWEDVSAPHPSGALESYLTAVSCAVSETCVTLGYYRETGGSMTQFSAGWNGETWTTASVPIPADSLVGAGLQDISCPTTTFCVAVGSYTTEFEEFTGIPLETRATVEVWNGSAWSIQSVPQPAGEARPALTGVSCTSATNCVAVGTNRLVETWNGSKWTIQSTPNLSAGHFTDVSCTASTACTAVGNIAKAGFAARWNGVEWSLQTSGLPGKLGSVSCGSATSCEAIGATLARRWNGVGWFSENIGVPYGGKEFAPEDLACPAARACMTAGQFAGRRPIAGTQPLAVQLRPLRALVPDRYPAVALGTNTTTHSLSTTLTTNCNTSTFASEVANTSTLFAASPVYANCTLAGLNMAVSLKANGCSLRFHPEIETSSEQFRGTLDIGPDGCGAITLSGLGCEQTIPPQHHVGNIAYANQGSGNGNYVTVSLSVSGLHYTSAGATCGSKTGDNGSYSGTWKVSGSVGGETIGVRLADELPVGVYVAGETLNEANPPRLEAEQFPVALTGQQDTVGKHALVTNAGKIECGQATFGAVAASAGPGLTINPSYASCTLYSIFGNIAVSPRLSGCSYENTLSGPPYVGNLELKCPEGASLQFSGPGCTVTIPAQTLATVEYANNGTQAARRVTMTLNGKELQYTYSGFTCGSGSAKNGTYKGSTTLYGSRMTAWG